MTRKKLFGTNGIRGFTQTDFTNEFCYDISRAFFEFLGKKGPICFGMDPRPGSERIKRALMQGIVSLGGKVADEGITPSPCLTYFVKVSDYFAGIEITGSHIRKDMNGIKFYIYDEEVQKKHEEQIEEIYRKLAKTKKFKPVRFRVSKENQAGRVYRKLLLSLADSQFTGYKVVVDGSNSTQSEIMPSVLKKLGVEVVERFCDLRGGLKVRDTEAGNPFQDLQEIVVKEKADFGVAYDPDGDRAVFFSEKGDYLVGDVACSIIAKHAGGNIVVTPINTSTVVEYIGKKVVRTKVGATYVAEKMKEVGASIGFEANGGVLSAEVIYGRDAGSATIKMLNILKKTGQPLSRLADEFPKFYLTRDKINCSSQYNEAIFKKVKEKYAGKKFAELDGLKIYLDKDSWLLFRPSGNAPEFRVWSEAKTKKKSQALYRKGMDLVSRVAAELSH